MQSIVGAVQTGPNPRVQVSCAGQIDIPANPTGNQSKQLWMFSGSGWVDNSPAVFTCTVKVSGNGQETTVPWKLQMTQIQDHQGLPLLMIQTDWPAGTYDYTITGDTNDCVWDLNDTMQVTVLQFDTAL